MGKKQSNFLLLSIVLASFIGIIVFFQSFALSAFGNVPIQASLQLPEQSGESASGELEDTPLFDVEITPGTKKSLYKDIPLFVWVIIGAFALLGVDIMYRKLGPYIRRKRKR